MPTIHQVHQDLLTRDGTVTVHHRNLRVLAIEMYKISHDLSPKFMKNLVEEIDTKYFTRSSYNVEKDGDGNTLCTKKLNYRPLLRCSHPESGTEFSARKQGFVQNEEKQCVIKIK